MLVREILAGGDDFPTVATDTLVRDAAETMRGADVRAVAVVEGERLLGILTDWDIVDAFAQRASELGELPVSAIMTKDDLITIGIGESVVDAAKKLADHRVHHLPVLDNGSYRGMICLGLEWSQPDLLTPPVRPTLTARHP